MKKEVRIGIIMIIVIAAFIWGFNFLKGNSIFKRTTDYYIAYADIDGLAVSNGVFIKGFKTGRVTNIKLNQDGLGNLIVTISVSKKLRIPKGSKAKIASRDLMGSKGVELYFTDNTVFCNEGDTLIGTKEQSVSSQIEPIKAEVESLLRNMDTLVHTTAMVFDERTIANLRMSIANISTTTGELAANSQKLAAIFTNLETITNNLGENNKLVMKALNSVTNITDSLDKADLKRTIDKTNTSLAQVQLLLNKVNEGKGTIGQLVNNDSLYHQLNQAAKNLNTLSLDIQQNPKRYVNFSVFGGKK